MSPSFCFAFSATATAISTTLVCFPSAYSLPPRTTRFSDPLFFGLDVAERERWTEGSLWIFFRTARAPALRRYFSACDILRAAVTPGGSSKKFNLQFVRLAACLIAISNSSSQSIFFFLLLQLTRLSRSLPSLSLSRFSRRRDGS